MAGDRRESGRPLDHGERLIRLQKFLSGAGVASRRKAEELIQQGRVSVNGQTVTELGTRVDPRKDQVALDGERVRSPQEAIYLLMNKPRGTVCTERDPEGRQRVHDLLPPGLPRLFTVGRLDYDTEGVLLLTTDGDLAQALTRPQSGVPRVYEVKVQGPPDVHLERRFSEGMRLDDGTRIKPAVVEMLRRTESNTWYEVVLTEGKNRQIHRMCLAVGKRVMKLRRTSYGPVSLGDLAVGAVRPLSPFEIDALRAAAYGG